MGKEVVVRAEADATVDDMEGVDCVVALGGDHTFLRASALIWDRSIPILGVNTNRHVYMGVLSPHFVDYEKREQHTVKLLETMEDDYAAHTRGAPEFYMKDSGPMSRKKKKKSSA
eukprot:CAMPEP_0185593234 /NCGR_PEP_ID=MMETSP0434-20130131/70826_1 /TAXON_ID=626734 ORGANISM="Favella taraikaensis, Strain Fe Narragansett Bay" /NCGR_SAMPLE_ID=MMETSP0434 /ASSEMBLY_ACC=CAM_ASM_000379 /LENGTH=114 /DNA_ID=CAMNT_0028219685 /DNA_START=193 /DNA_END=538 /DNA_ORIENTATION=+